jgi:hypothetical protein
MEWWTWLLILVVVLTAALVAFAMVQRRKRQRRTAQLRDRFGPEYKRTVESAGGRRKGEAELEQRLRRRQDLEIAVPADTSGYRREWEALEAQFEEAPLPAVARAEALATTVLADRGYPMDSFSQRTADLSVDHPEAVEHYRRAHETYRAADESGASAEDLYEALQHYRALLEDIVGDGFSPPATRAAAAESLPQRPPTHEPLLVDDQSDR